MIKKDNYLHRESEDDNSWKTLSSYSPFSQLLCFTHFTTFILYLSHFNKLIPLLFILSIINSFAAETTSPTLWGNRAKVRVGFFEFDGYHSIDPDGNFSGYGYEYLQHLSIHTGWTYEYIGHDKGWPAMLPMLENGEVDLLTSAVKTPAKLEKFDFSEKPIGISGTIMTVKAGNKKYLQHDYKNWKGIRVGILRGNSKNDSFANFAKEKGFTYTTKEFDVTKDLCAALQKEEVDAIVTGSLRRPSNEWTYEFFDIHPFYVIVKKGNTELLNKINEAIDKIELANPSLSEELQNKYYGLQSNKIIPLLNNERRFIENCKNQNIVFKAIINPDRAPFSYYSKGKLDGIMPLIVSKITKRTGLPIEIVPVYTRLEYNQLRQQTNITLCLDAWYDFSHAEHEGYYLSPPYLTANISYIHHKTFFGSPKKVGIVRDSNILYELQQSSVNHQGMQIIMFDTMEEVIQAILQKKIDAAYIYTLTAGQVIEKDYSSLIVTDSVYGLNTRFSVGIRHGSDLELISIINKAVQSISKEEIESIIHLFHDQPPIKLSLWHYIILHPIEILGTIICIFAIAITILIKLLYSRRRIYQNASILELLPINFYVINRQGSILLHSIWSSDPEVSAHKSYKTLADLPQKELNSMILQKMPSVIDSGKTTIVQFEEKNYKRSISIFKLPHKLFQQDTVVCISQDISQLLKEKNKALSLAERLKLTLQSIGDGVISTDANGNIQMLNFVAEQLTGWSLEEAQGRNHEEIFHTEDYHKGTSTISPIKQVLSTGKTVSLANHTDLISKNGSRYHIANTAAPIHDTKGKLIGAILIFRDVTLEDHQRDTIQETLALLESAIKMSKTAVFWISTNTCDLYGSAMVQDFWPTKEGRRLPLDQFVYKEDVAKTEQAFDKILQSPEKNGEFVYYRSTYFGRMRYFRFKGIAKPITDSTQHRIIGIIQDITEDTIKAQTDKILNICLERLFNEPNPLTVIDQILRTVCSNMNAAYCHLVKLGVSTINPSMVGGICVSEVSALAKTSFFKINKESISCPTSNIFYQKLLQHKNVFIPNLLNEPPSDIIGGYLSVAAELQLKSILVAGIWKDKQLWGYIALVYQDNHNNFADKHSSFLNAITHLIEIMLEREQSQKRILNALDQAQKANNAKSYFIASISHEIRTPLNAILAFSDLLTDEDLDHPTRKEYTDSIIFSGNALLRLVNDVLDLSNLENDQLRIHKKQANFHKLCHNITKIFSFKAEKQNIQLLCKIQPMPLLVIDEQRIRQTLTNLVGNAIRFTLQGSVTLSAQFTLDENGKTGTLQCAVADTGVGVSEEDQKNLTEPFVKLSRMRGTYTNNNGTGLSLAISKRLIEKMGGQLSLVSTLGKGSTFSFCLPHVSCIPLSEGKDTPPEKPSPSEPDNSPSDTKEK